MMNSQPLLCTDEGLKSNDIDRKGKLGLHAHRRWGTLTDPPLKTGQRGALLGILMPFNGSFHRRCLGRGLPVICVSCVLDLITDYLFGPLLPPGVHFYPSIGALAVSLIWSDAGFLKHSKRPAVA